MALSTLIIHIMSWSLQTSFMDRGQTDQYIYIYKTFFNVGCIKLLRAAVNRCILLKALQCCTDLFVNKLSLSEKMLRFLLSNEEVLGDNVADMTVCSADENLLLQQNSLILECHAHMQQNCSAATNRCSAA